MFIRFSHVMIYSRNQSAAVQWYCDKLGYEVDYNAPNEYTSLHHKLLGRLAIHASDAIIPNGSVPMPYLLCNDLDKVLSDLKKMGVQVSTPAQEGESPRFADFTDLDGNRWGIEEL